jgi:hypothetical protein
MAGEPRPRLPILIAALALVVGGIVAAILLTRPSDSPQPATPTHPVAPTRPVSSASAEPGGQGPTRPAVPAGSGSIAVPGGTGTN